MSRDIFQLIRLLRALASLTLNESKDGFITTSLGNTFQCFLQYLGKEQVKYFSSSVQKILQCLGELVCLHFGSYV